MFDSHIEGLCSRISKYLKPGMSSTQNLAGSGNKNLQGRSQTARQDLVQFKADLRTGDDDMNESTSTLASLPAEVPLLPIAFRKNPEMLALKAKVLDRASGARIGFFGMVRLSMALLRVLCSRAVEHWGQLVHVRREGQVKR
eukprot:SAG31_NODE_1150_length_9648_cov_37.362656_2_plen_142_part_00